MQTKMLASLALLEQRLQAPPQAQVVPVSGASSSGENSSPNQLGGTPAQEAPSSKAPPPTPGYQAIAADYAMTLERGADCAADGDDPDADTSRGRSHTPKRLANRTMTQQEVSAQNEQKLKSIARAEAAELRAENAALVAQAAELQQQCQKLEAKGGHLAVMENPAQLPTPGFEAPPGLGNDAATERSSEALQHQSVTEEPEPQVAQSTTEAACSAEFSGSPAASPAKSDSTPMDFDALEGAEGQE